MLVAVPFRVERLASFVRWATEEEMAIASKHGGAGFVGTR